MLREEKKKQNYQKCSKLKRVGKKWKIKKKTGQ